MKVLVAGASGFVGRRLCPALEEAGHEVRAMTRHPDTYEGAGTAVGADVQDADSLDEAMAGCDAAYYLVHSLDDDDFENKDAAGATTFGAAAEERLRRLVGSRGQAHRLRDACEQRAHFLVVVDDANHVAHA